MINEADVRSALEGTLNAEAVHATLLAYSLSAYGVQTLYAAYSTERYASPGQRYHVWFACDIGLVFCTISGTAAGEMPTALGDLTSWRDVRDVELRGDVGQLPDEVAHMPGASVEVFGEDWGFARAITFTIQVPRFDACARERDTANALAKFARHVLIQYQKHG